MCDFFPRLEHVRARPKYPYMPIFSLGGLPVSSINSVHRPAGTGRAGRVMARPKFRPEQDPTRPDPIRPGPDQLNIASAATGTYKHIYTYIYIL